MHCKVEAKWGVEEALKHIIGVVEKYGPIVGEVFALFKKELFLAKIGLLCCVPLDSASDDS
jgi:hypothetical protein